MSPRSVRISNLYAAPSTTSGMKISQIPDPPSTRIACRRPSQELKSPTTLTARRGRRPHSERGAQCAVDLAHMRPQPLVDLLVAPLPAEVQIDVPERGREGIGVAKRIHVAVRVAHLELVAQRQPGTVQKRLEEPRRMALLEHHRLRALRSREHLPRVRAEGTDHDAAVDGVRAQHVVRIRMPTRHDQLNLGLDRHASGASSRRPEPRSRPLLDPHPRRVWVPRVRRLAVILPFSRRRPGRFARSAVSALRASTRPSDISLQALVTNHVHDPLCCHERRTIHSPIPRSFGDILSARAPARQPPTWRWA